MNLLARALERLVPPGRSPPARRGSQGPLVVKGVVIPSPDVASTVARLRGFQRDFERVFLALAEGLPHLSQSVAALTAPFASLQDPASGIVGTVEAEVAAMAGVGRDATREVLTHSEAGLEQARLLVAGADTLVQQLRSVERVSLTLRLAGLNASFSVDGLGERGAAFTAVNRALIEVAEEASSVAEATGAIARQISEAAARVGATQEGLAAEIARETAASEQRSRAAMAECGQVLAQLGSVLGDLTGRGAQVVEATGVIMAAIQRQDILRQGLDHVILVLEALGAEAERLGGTSRPAPALMAFLSFQEQAGRLATDLLRSLREQLEALLRMVQVPVDGLGVASRAIAGRTGDHAAIERNLTAASEHVAEGFAALFGVGGTDDCETEVAQLEEQLRTLGPRVAALEKIPLQLDMVTILLRSEIAHLRELAGLERVTQELRDVGGSLRELHLAATEEVALVASRVPLARQALRRQGQAWEGLHRLPAQLEAPSSRVHEIAAGFRAHLDRLQGAGQALDREAGTLLADLTTFAQALTVTDSVRTACEGWCAEAGQLREQLQALGLEPAPPTRSLHALIEGFTLFEHKQIALAGPAPPSQSAGEPGELTLF